MFLWLCTTTCRTRYVGDDYNDRRDYDASSDVIELVKEYVSTHQKRSLSILDVGCSTGEASAYMKEKLVGSGLEVTIAGVDPYTTVFDCARKNLDKFYEGCIEKAKIEEEYDIVLSARLMRFAPLCKQKTLIAACAKHCAPDGVIITDGIPVTMRNTYHMVSKSRAAEYEESLVAAWASVDRLFRFRRTLCMHCKDYEKQICHKVGRIKDRMRRRPLRSFVTEGCE